jgi:hypothetical protein
MSCQNFEAIIIGMARAQLLEVGARREALAHLAQCDACADKFAEQQALTAVVRATARSLAAAEASAAVEHRLRAAFRGQAASGAAPTFGNGPIQRWQWSGRLAFAAAAVLLVTVFTGWLWQWSRGDQNPALATTPRGTASPIPASPDKLPERLAPTSPPVPEGKPQVAIKPRKGRPAVRQGLTNEEEVAASFIALAGEGELVPLESGQVLRVELSASTLISMGLPILAEDVSKPVLADLLLGQDGMARAIRFVKPGVAADVGAPQSANNR